MENDINLSESESNESNDINLSESESNDSNNINLSESESNESNDSNDINLSESESESESNDSNKDDIFINLEENLKRYKKKDKAKKNKDLYGKYTQRHVRLTLNKQLKKVG